MPNFASEHFKAVSIYDFDFVAFRIWNAIAVEQMFEYGHCDVSPFLAERNSCLQLSGYNGIAST